MKTYLVTINEGIIRLDPEDVEVLDPGKLYQVQVEVREVTGFRKWGKKMSYKTNKPII